MTVQYVPHWPPFTFGGVENPPMENSRAVVIPVPFDSTSSYRPGARNGPESIIDASRYMELFDHETGWSPVEIGIHTMEGIEPSRGNVEKTLDRVRSVTSEVIDSGRFPIVLGGEHSISVGAVAAAARRWKDLSVVILDAHSDMRDEYEGSRYSHACSTMRISELVDSLEVFGNRSCSEEEWELIRDRGLPFHFWRDDDHRGSVDEMMASVTEIAARGRPLYLSIDLDVINPSEMPAVGTPEPSGPSYDDLLPVLRRLGPELVGLDVVELTPIPGENRSQFMVAKIIYKILAYRFAGGEPG
jgi:agmatinase